MRCSCVPGGSRGSSRAKMSMAAAWPCLQWFWSGVGKRRRGQDAGGRGAHVGAGCGVAASTAQLTQPPHRRPTLLCRPRKKRPSSTMCLRCGCVASASRPSESPGFLRCDFAGKGCRRRQGQAARASAAWGGAWQAAGCCSGMAAPTGGGALNVASRQWRTSTGGCSTTTEGAAFHTRSAFTMCGPV
jgi:hypothetical protein